MKLYCDGGSEAYPVYEVLKDRGERMVDWCELFELEFTDEEAEFLLRVQEENEKAQEMIGERVKQQRTKY